jgi:hypothetical protein
MIHTKHHSEVSRIAITNHHQPLPEVQMFHFQQILPNRGVIISQSYMMQAFIYTILGLNQSLPKAIFCLQFPPPFAK